MISRKIYPGDQYGPRYERTNNFLPAANLNVGAKVVCLCSRLSSSNWQRKTNVNHGWVEIEGVVTKILPNGKRVVELDKEQVEEWENPIGNELFKQAVGGIGRHVDHIIKYCGY